MRFCVAAAAVKEVQVVEVALLQSACRTFETPSSSSIQPTPPFHTTSYTLGADISLPVFPHCEVWHSQSHHEIFALKVWFYMLNVKTSSVHGDLPRSTYLDICVAMTESYHGGNMLY